MAIGASAGGFAALERLLGELPAGFPPAVFVVLHLDRQRKSLLTALLARRAQMTVRPAVEDEEIHGGTVYIAVPDFHLQVRADHIRLVKSSLVHFTRPAVDRLFESVALAYGPHAVGVVLTGAGGDGADGVVAIRRAGGVTIAQAPADAAYSAMPLAAIATGCVDHVVPLAGIAGTLLQLCAAPAAPLAES
ncbi:MAG TPA: chemotaxis protein CheB [Methylomirabilota bacterium]|nr:chemotaxis protein CheB [Methylomirabilota bacterium]